MKKRRLSCIYQTFFLRKTAAAFLSWLLTNRFLHNCPCGTLLCMACQKTIKQFVAAAGELGVLRQAATSHKPHNIVYVHKNWTTSALGVGSDGESRLYMKIVREKLLHLGLALWVADSLSSSRPSPQAHCGGHGGHLLPRPKMATWTMHTNSVSAMAKPSWARTQRNARTEHSITWSRSWRQRPIHLGWAVNQELRSQLGGVLLQWGLGASPTKVQPSWLSCFLIH